MKIRKHRKKTWVFAPHKNSSLKKHYSFKRKSKLMAFLNANFEEVLNGDVLLNGSSFNASGCIRIWVVWYNQYSTSKTLKIVLKQRDFRGKKYVFKPRKISKKQKKYLAFSQKVISLMCRIEDEENDNAIHPKDAKRLMDLFYKRGFKDFEPTEDDKEYINRNIEDGIPFFYWSDRCNFLRCKTILEYFKQKKLI